MAKSSIRTRVPASGATIGVTMPYQMLEAFTQTIQHGEVRTALEQALRIADENRAVSAVESRLDTILSIESLAPLGWMMVGEHSPIAYGAVRTGDFRLATCEGRTGWEFGPSGAFDREGDDVVIMRGATQAGVMSEKHCAYHLAPPVQDRQTAVDGAAALEKVWRTTLPHKTTPLWTRATHLAKLVGDVQVTSGARHIVRDISTMRRREDEMLRGRTGNVHVFPYDARLASVTRYDGQRNLLSTTGMGWTFARYRRDPGDEHDVHLLDGPYDCLMAGVWAAASDAGYQSDALARETMNGQRPPRPLEHAPLADGDEALEAARNIAARIDATGARVDDDPPSTVAIPDFGNSWATTA